MKAKHVIINIKLVVLAFVFTLTTIRITIVSYDILLVALICLMHSENIDKAVEGVIT